MRVVGSDFYVIPFLSQNTFMECQTKCSFSNGKPLNIGCWSQNSDILYSEFLINMRTIVLYEAQKVYNILVLLVPLLRRKGPIRCCVSSASDCAEMFHNISC